MIYQVGKKQCSNSGRKRNDIDPQESDFKVQPPSPLEFPGLLTPPPPWNFQFPPWWGSGYFLEPHSINFLVLCRRPCWVNPCPFHSVPQGTLYWNCWSYRTFALMEVSPQSYKEWQHYSYRGTNMYHPMLFVFGKAISLSDAPSKQQSMTAH